MGTGTVFASAYVGSKQKKLLKQEQFRTMIDSDNIDDICRTLQDAGYGSDSQPFTVKNYQKILKDERDDMFDLFKSDYETFGALDVLLYPNDYHNIKVLLKAEALELDRSDILLDTGSIPAAQMAELVRDRDKSILTECMHKAVVEAAETHARTRDPQQIDFICDQYSFMDCRRLAEQSGNEFVIGYQKLCVDIANIKSMLRIKDLGYEAVSFENCFIEGGTIDKKVFLSSYNEDEGQLITHFEGTVLQSAVARGCWAHASTGSYQYLEAYCDDTLMEYVREAKAITFGLEPVFAYAVAKEMEMKNIRILMAGKLLGADAETTSERMRETYE